MVTLLICGLPHPIPRDVAIALGLVDGAEIIDIDTCARIITLQSARIAALEKEQPAALPKT